MSPELISCSSRASTGRLRLAGGVLLVDGRATCRPELIELWINPLFLS